MVILAAFDTGEKQWYDKDMSWQTILLYVLFIWSLIWNGIALWYAAKNNQRNWFVVMLVIHTAGILEIAYLFFFAKKKLRVEDLMFWKK